MLPLDTSAIERRNNNILFDEPINPIESKICSIRGRILNENDVGSYIIRPQPKPCRDVYDWSWVPRQFLENFTEIRLSKINPDGTLEISSEEWAARNSTFRNDGGWLPVQELKAHLKATGECLALVSSSGIFFEKQEM